jgi:hypothetical protein
MADEPPFDSVSRNVNALVAAGISIAEVEIPSDAPPSESELLAAGASWCLCLVCGARWEIVDITDTGADGHAYGTPCPRADAD